MDINHLILNQIILLPVSYLQSQEKYDRAVKKINQMKEERKELKEKLDIQSEEISR